MVAMNYRLGALGFLSLAVDDLSGNMGLLDQVMALQWINENIENFGGDPNRITIMGQSAGSWSVFYHVMSPLSTGLFKNVIGQSGSVTSPGIQQYSADQAHRWGQEYVTAVGCDESEIVSKQIKCLQEKNVETLVGSFFGYHGANAVVDGQFSMNAFLPQSPKELMQEGLYNSNVNILMGSTRDEGILFLYPAIKNNTILEEMKRNWKDWQGAFMLLGIEPGMQNDEDLKAVDDITNFYLGNLDNMNIEHIHNIIEMLTDSAFGYGVHDFISRHTPFINDSTMQQYIYFHEGEYSLSANLDAGRYGVCHADETYLQFHPFYIPNHGLNSADQSVSEIILTLWKNFIKFGTAGTDELNWIPIHFEEDGTLYRKYLRLTYSESSFMEYPKEWQDRMIMWDNVIYGLENVD